MSIHKLTAGSGYDYLTRQVAAQDATEKGHTGLASYYSQRGETPGQWLGSGMAGIDGLAAGDVVTAEQMQALFGSGHHPVEEAAERLGVGRTMMYALVKSGAIESICIGRLRRIPGDAVETSSADCGTHLFSRKPTRTTGEARPGDACARSTVTA